MVSNSNSSKSRDYKKGLKNFIDLQLLVHVMRIELQGGVTRERFNELKLLINAHYQKLYDTREIFRDLFDKGKITEYVYLEFLKDFMDGVIDFKRGRKTIQLRIMKEINKELIELGELADRKAKALLKK